MLRRRGVQVKSRTEIEAMRVAGLLVATTLARLQAAVAPGVSTGELDRLAAETIRDGGGVPSFLGYHGYPATICASVNERIVHGIPSDREVLREGDIVSLDCGAIVDGWHGDSAVTVPVGEVGDDVARLVETCRQALWTGLDSVRDGSRLGDIGAAIEAEARGGGFGLVEDYTGHGIGTEMHQEPAVPNLGRPGKGLPLRVGMALAIEPMITLGAADNETLADDWTVVTLDGSFAAHWEHTVAVTPSGPWVLTAAGSGSYDAPVPPRELALAAR